jgi:hypothetical protein
MKRYTKRVCAREMRYPRHILTDVGSIIGCERLTIIVRRSRITAELLQGQKCAGMGGGRVEELGAVTVYDKGGRSCLCAQCPRRRGARGELALTVITVALRTDSSAWTLYLRGAGEGCGERPDSESYIRLLQSLRMFLKVLDNYARPLIYGALWW